MKRSRGKNNISVDKEKDDDLTSQNIKNKKSNKFINSQEQSNIKVHELIANINENVEEEYNQFLNNINNYLTKFEMKPKFFYKPIDKSNDILIKILNITKFKMISPMEIYYKLKYEVFHKMSLEDDKCSICQFNFYDDNLKDKTIEEISKLNDQNKDNYDVILLNNCADHFFHLECLNNLIGDKSFIKCPNCNKIYGIITGDQPKGKMSASLTDDYNCEGFEGIETIVIYYDFPSGKDYSGTSRIAYLPNTKEGREVLALLKVSFDRKLTFTVGTSVTTGQTNTTIWNGVHHKTNLSGGSQYFGYPDQTYFNRVKQELAAKGVVEENIPESLETIADNFIIKKEKIGKTNTYKKKPKKK